jgi:glycosyltransferase involved in cell wall biosynthesis
MTIGINVTAAIKQPRTGVEEYTYQLIKHLTMLPEARKHRFLLYLPSVVPQGGTKEGLPDTNSRISTDDTNKEYFDFSLPPNFEIKVLRWPLPFLWTQIRLAWEMIVQPPEFLFIPVHILPIFHPKNSLVAIHGLEYEYFPQYYPFWHRLYLRLSTKYALKNARKIIAISENTKQDLIKFYGGKADKIKVVHHGIKFPISPPAWLRRAKRVGNFPGLAFGLPRAGQFPNKLQIQNSKIQKPYVLFIGRVETKKNIQGLLEAYKILKEKYNVPHQLVLAGAPGYGYKNIKNQISKIKNKEEIILTGFVSEGEKWQLLAGADVFVLLSFYEGFGLPILEAQAAGVPVVTSYNSSLPEIAGEGALFINPKNSAQIAEAAKKIIDDKALRDTLIQLGYKNVRRFSWEKCAKETLDTLLI